jgi:hypothetical protein
LSKPDIPTLRGLRECESSLRPFVVPIGTVITVRLGQSVGSKISEPGQNFSATVASPVEVEGKTAIPSGASASGTVVDAKPLGRFKGGAVLQLKLTSININGSIGRSKLLLWCAARREKVNAQL